MSTVHLLVTVPTLSLALANLIAASDYFYDTGYINLKYYIPGEQGINFYKSLFTPFILLITGGNTDLGLIIKELLILLFGLVILYVKRSQYLLIIGLFLILGLANIRYADSGFHFLPWLAILTSIVGFLSVNLLLKKGVDKKWRITVILMLTIIFVNVLYYAMNSLFKKTDRANDAYVHYSQQYDYGHAVQIMKAKDETLMVAPIEPLILWQADTPHATKYTFYYSWMAGVPVIKNEIVQAFTKNPPTYFYYNTNYGEIGLEKYLEKYQNLPRNGKSTYLYILKTKVLNLSSKQIDQLRFFDFEFKKD